MTKEIISHAKQRRLGTPRQQKCYLPAHGAPELDSFDLKVKAIEGNGCRTSMKVKARSRPYSILKKGKDGKKKRAVRSPRPFLYACEICDFERKMV